MKLKVRRLNLELKRDQDLKCQLLNPSTEVVIKATELNENTCRDRTKADGRGFSCEPGAIEGQQRRSGQRA